MKINFEIKAFNKLKKLFTVNFKSENQSLPKDQVLNDNIIDDPSLNYNDNQEYLAEVLELIEPAVNIGHEQKLLGSTKNFSGQFVIDTKLIKEMKDMSNSGKDAFNRSEDLSSGYFKCMIEQVEVDRNE